MCSIKWVPRVPSVLLSYFFVFVCVSERVYVCVCRGVRGSGLWVPRVPSVIVLLCVVIMFLCVYVCSVKWVPRVPNVLHCAFTVFVCVCDLSSLNSQALKRVKCHAFS